MNLTCPCCHAHFPVESALEEADARETLRALIAIGPLAQPLAAYLGLFRSASRSLGWGRALRLSKEVMALTPDRTALARALGDTVEALRTKGMTKPLANHNYLKRVLESVNASGSAWAPVESHLAAGRRPQGQPSKTLEGMASLVEWEAKGGGPAWLRREIKDGFQRLLALRLTDAPAADVIKLMAETWMENLTWQFPGWVESVDAIRVKEGFTKMLNRTKWPSVASLETAMPDDTYVNSQARKAEAVQTPEITEREK
ncbi:MAG: hypothetical protein OEV94_11885 [Deltaproteobacteria bacterium]|nr:hypothetical protein [Deltaproteobacteria bacterium]